MDWDCGKSLYWDLGFGLKINWDPGLGTPHKTPPMGRSLISEFLYKKKIDFRTELNVIYEPFHPVWVSSAP